MASVGIQFDQITETWSVTYNLSTFYDIINRLERKLKQTKRDNLFTLRNKTQQNNKKS